MLTSWPYLGTGRKSKIGLKLERDRPMELDSLKHRLLNLKAAIFLLMVIATLYYLSHTRADPDLWGYLAFGRLFWTQGRFPYLDVFAYVPTLKPWVYHEWLTGVLFYPIYRTLGDPGLQILKNVLGLATVGATYLTARRRGADPLPIALILFISLDGLSMGYSPVRAQVFTFLFFAVFLYLLETARLSGNRRRLWLLVPIQIVWCNLHGGFLAGLGLILLYAVGEALSRRPFRPYLGWFLLAGLATLVNPYGLKYWVYLAKAVTMPRPEITEWLSLFGAYKQGILTSTDLFYFLNLIVVAVFLVWWSRWREITPALVILFTLYLGVRHNRHLVFFALTFAAYMPVLLTAFFRELKTRSEVIAWMQRLGGKIPALVVIVLIFFFSYRLISRNPLILKLPSEPNQTGEYEIYYPVGAINYLQQRHLSGKLLVFFNWGEYCLWKLYPQCHVAIDGRYETVYPPSLNKEYFDFLDARKNWRDFLKDYPPDMILIDLRSKLYALLSRDPQWRQVYADSGCVLFRRQGEVAVGPAQAHSQP
jgi:hypothetical protein